MYLYVYIKGAVCGLISIALLYNVSSSLTWQISHDFFMDCCLNNDIIIKMNQANK